MDARVLGVVTSILPVLDDILYITLLYLTLYCQDVPKGNTTEEPADIVRALDTSRTNPRIPIAVRGRPAKQTCQADQKVTGYAAVDDATLVCLTSLHPQRRTGGRCAYHDRLCIGLGTSHSAARIPSLQPSRREKRRATLRYSSLHPAVLNRPFHQ